MDAPAGAGPNEAFLLRLSDTLQSLSDPVQIEGAATRLFGAWAGSSWAYYLELDDRQRTATIRQDYTSGNVPTMVGVHPLDDLQDLLAAIATGEVFAEQFATSTIVSERARAHYMAIGMKSFLCAPVVWQGRIEAALTLADTRERDWRPCMATALEAARRTWQAIARTRAEAALRASADHQRLLVGELQHRVRNNLAMVSIIVRRTLGAASTLGSAAMLLDRRIAALVRVQSLLTRAPGAGVALQELVRDALVAHDPLIERLVIDGDAVRLSERAAEILSLTMYELAANAVKSGALDGDGVLAVRWRLAHRDDGAWLTLIWSEAGLNQAEPAAPRDRFATELIERRIPYELGGNGTLVLRPDGLTATIEFPLVPGESTLSTAPPDTPAGAAGP